jgi:hypothetical protein
LRKAILQFERVYKPEITCKISLLAGINIGAIHEGFKDYGMALKFYEEVRTSGYLSRFTTAMARS